MTSFRRTLFPRAGSRATNSELASALFSTSVLPSALRPPNRYPVRRAHRKSKPLVIRCKKVVPDILRANRIVHSLSNARAARASAYEGAVVATRTAAKRNAVAVRMLRVTNTRRNAMFVRTVRMVARVL